MTNNSAGDNICLMYQLEQYWKKNSIYHNKLSIKSIHCLHSIRFDWLAIIIQKEYFAEKREKWLKDSIFVGRQRELSLMIIE